MQWYYVREANDMRAVVNLLFYFFFSKSKCKLNDLDQSQPELMNLIYVSLKISKIKSSIIERIKHFKVYVHDCMKLYCLIYSDFLKKLKLQSFIFCLKFLRIDSFLQNKQTGSELKNLRYHRRQLISQFFPNLWKDSMIGFQ